MQSKNVQILDKSTSATIPKDAVGKKIPVLNPIKHNLPILAPPLREKSDTRANKPACINNVEITPHTADKTYKSLEIQTDISYIVSKNDFEILEIVKSKGFTKESLSRLQNVRSSHSGESEEVEIKYNAENLSLPQNINNDVIIDLCDTDDYLINEETIKNVLSQSELNKTLLTKCYEVASSTSRKEHSVGDYSETKNLTGLITAVIQALSHSQRKLKGNQAKPRNNMSTQYAYTDFNTKTYTNTYSPISDASDTEIPTDPSLQEGRNISAQLLTPQVLQKLGPTRELASPRVQILPIVQTVNDENISAQEQPQNTQQKQFPEQNTQPTQYIQHNTKQYRYPISYSAHRDPRRQNLEHQIVQKQYQQFPSNMQPANNYAQYYQHNINLQMSGAMHRQQSYVNTWNANTDIPRGASAIAQQTAAANIVASTNQESFRHQGLPKMPSRRGRKPSGAATRTTPHRRQLTLDQVNQYNRMMEQCKILQMEQQQRHWESQLQNYPNSSWSQAHAFKRPQ